MEQPTWNKIMGKPALAKLWHRVQCDDGSIKLTPADVRDAHNEFLGEFPCAHAGGAHIVIADDNNETDHIGWCLLQLLEDHGTPDDNDASESIHYLCCLLRLDDEERVWPNVDEYEFFDGTKVTTPRSQT